MNNKVFNSSLISLHPKSIHLTLLISYKLFTLSLSRMEFIYHNFTLAGPCSLYWDILQRHRFLKNRHILSFKNMIGRYKHLVGKYSVTCVQMTTDCIGNLILIQSWLLFPYSDGFVYYLICIWCLRPAVLYYIELICYIWQLLSHD